MKKFLVILIMPVLFYSGCMLEQMPTTVERSTKYKIVLKDNSGYMQKLYGSNRVRNAVITLKSNMQGNEFRLVTDSSGTAEITGLISDNYLVTAERFMTTAEMLAIEGIFRSDIKLSNVNFRVVNLNPSNNEVDIMMEKVIGEQALIISEVYASGPSGSGLYYHDKYVEIYNQSDSVQYLDKLIIAQVYMNNNLGIQFRDDSVYIHSKSIWIFPGNGRDYPIQPGQFVVCAEDAMDHRINAPNSVDLSHVSFEFYKDDAPDVDNPNVPNMIRIYQDAGNDWLIGGEKDALVLAAFPIDQLVPYNDQFMFTIKSVIDGMEYLSDPTVFEKKKLTIKVDAGATGGIQFYTGKSMERKTVSVTSRRKLKDENNSSVDFEIISAPTPERYH